MSHLFPGIGQFYNGERVKGGLFLVTTLVCLVLMFYFLATGFGSYIGSVISLSDPNYAGSVDSVGNLGPGLLCMLSVIVLFLWSIIDAWKVAKRRGATSPEEPATPSKPEQELVLPPPPPGS